MKSSNELRTMLRSIDHKSYPAYKSLGGAYQFGSYILSIDHVQGDPFASPSSLHVEVGMAAAGFPLAYYKEDHTRIALQDFLVRGASQQFNNYNFKAKGSGKSGLISISRCGQEVLERSACTITEKSLVLRFHVGFPAFGRTINASELEKILFEFLPCCIENSLFYKKLDGKKVESVIHLAEDQAAVRRIIMEEGWHLWPTAPFCREKAVFRIFPLTIACLLNHLRHWQERLRFPTRARCGEWSSPKALR